jgi:hypothetical protein
LTELWSHKLIATLIAIRPEHHFGQEVLHGDLQCLHYHLVGLHMLYPKIDKVMEFPSRLNVKQILENLSLETRFIALFGHLKQIIPDLNNFCRFAHL